MILTATLSKKNNNMDNLYNSSNFNLSDKFKKVSALSGAKLVVLSIIVSLVFGLLGGGISGFYFFQKTQNVPVTEEGGYIAETDQEQKIINAIESVSPSVVSIIISKDVPIYEQYYVNPFDGDPFFGDLFRVPQQRQIGTEEQEIGGGTGVIVSSDGMIITNKHVVSDDKAEYTIFTNDGKKYPAKVLAKDPVQDLAVIKIEEADSFPFASLGDSDKLQLGQTVITIGNALGEYRNTVSVGVISGLGRTITASSGDIIETLEDIIQTDAPINQGNSGGPLLNLKGEVIGINTATVLDAQSIGFSIPINKAKRDIEQVKTSGKIVYPFLGIRYLMINDKIKEQKKLSVDYGALVERGEDGQPAISSDSAAEKAGLKEKDIILEINGQKITTENSLSKMIVKYNPGDKITLKILRGDEEKTIEVVLGERTE